MRIEYCPSACARARWYEDESFPHLGQHNCPYRFGVTWCAATIDGKPTCKHFVRKERG